MIISILVVSDCWVELLLLFIIQGYVYLLETMIINLQLLHNEHLLRGIDRHLSWGQFQHTIIVSPLILYQVITVVSRWSFTYCAHKTHYISASELLQSCRKNCMGSAVKWPSGQYIYSQYFCFHCCIWIRLYIHTTECVLLQKPYHEYQVKCMLGFL